MDARAHIGFGPKILIAIQDVNGFTRVYTGIVIDGSISIEHPVEDVGIEAFVHAVHVGSPSVRLDVEFSLQYQGADMKTWADIKKPEEIDAPQPTIDPPRTV